MEASDYYPFTDENFPGRFNFTVYKRVGLTDEVQCSYALAYEGLSSIDDWIEKTTHRTKISPHSSFRKVPGALIRPCVFGLPSHCENNLRDVIQKYGGYREKAIMNQNPYIVISETWNDDHRVIHVISGCDAEHDNDGHRNSFDFDLVTNKICG